MTTFFAAIGTGAFDDFDEIVQFNTSVVPEIGDEVVLSHELIIGRVVARRWDIDRLESDEHAATAVRLLIEKQR